MSPKAPFNHHSNRAPATAAQTAPRHRTADEVKVVEHFLGMARAQ